LISEDQASDSQTFFQKTHH